MKADSSLVRTSIHNFKTAFEPLFGRGTIGSNSFLSFTSLSVQFLVNMILVMILARLVDVGILGEILYATTLSSIVVVLASFGFENLVVREIAQARFGLVELTANLLIAKSALAITLLLLIYLFIQVVSIPLKNPHDLWFYVGAALANSLVNSFNALRKGKNDFFTEFKVSLARSGLFFFGVLVAIQIWDATTLLIGQVRLVSRILALAVAVAAFIHASRKDNLIWTGWGVRLQVVKNLFVLGIPFAFQAILSTAYYQIDTVVLGALGTSKDVGYYQAAAQVISGVMLVPVAVIQAFYPRLALEFSSAHTKNSPLMKRMLGVLAISGLCLTAIFGLGAPFLIELLYSPQMEPSVVVLRILSLVFVVRSVAGGFGISLISIGWPKILAFTGLVALVVSLTLNLIFIPQGGFVAVAWINLITNLLVLSIYALWWQRVQPKFVDRSEKIT